MALLALLRYERVPWAADRIRGLACTALRARRREKCRTPTITSHEMICPKRPREQKSWEKFPKNRDFAQNNCPKFDTFCSHRLGLAQDREVAQVLDRLQLARRLEKGRTPTIHKTPRFSLQKESALEK